MGRFSDLNEALVIGLSRLLSLLSDWKLVILQKMMEKDKQRRPYI